jgi:transmembrane sensor
MRQMARPDDAETEDAVRSAARNWIVTVAEDPARRQACAAWRAADPAHEDAWQEANRVWTQAADLGALDRPGWRAEIEALTVPAWRRSARWALAASIVLALGGTLYVRSLPDVEAETAVAETRRLALADGSQVTLSAQSGVAVHFARGSRRVVLDHGQVFFEVAHDTARPFTVIAGGAEIRVTGTKFDVRKVGDDVRVSVLEGRVELRRQGLLPLLTPERPDRILTAGLSSELAPGAAHFTPETQALIPAGDWRTGRLFYNEAPLADIVADLRRYSATAVRIDDPAVARMKLTTSFRAGQTAAFLDSLPAALPVQLARAADGAVLIEARAQEP